MHNGYFLILFNICCSMLILSTFMSFRALSKPEISSDYKKEDSLYKNVSRAVFNYQVGTYLFLALALVIKLFSLIEAPGKGIVISEKDLLIMAFPVASCLLFTIALIFKVRELKK